MCGASCGSADEGTRGNEALGPFVKPPGVPQASWVKLPAARNRAMMGVFAGPPSLQTLRPRAFPSRDLKLVRAGGRGPTAPSMRRTLAGSPWVLGSRGTGSGEPNLALGPGYRNRGGKGTERRASQNRPEPLHAGSPPGPGSPQSAAGAHYHGPLQLRAQRPCSVNTTEGLHLGSRGAVSVP